MKNYVEVAYQVSEKPFGEYPLQLAKYLMSKYSLQRNMKILDNGCGRGEFLHAFSVLGMQVEGADISNYCPQAKMVDLNNEKLPFPDESFDVVFSKSVIEHISNTEHYMSEMKRVLKKGGLLLLLVPDWETQYFIFYQDPTHIHPYTRASIYKLLKMMEYENVESDKFIQLPCVWNNKILKGLSYSLRLFGPVKKIYKNKFIRFSRELMILGSGRKEDRADE